MHDCPTRAAFERYFAGECEAAEADALLAHAETCGACRAELDASSLEEALAGELRRASAGTRPSPGAARATDPPDIARYRIVRFVGQGAMGRVFEAEQKHPSRTVALKVVQTGVTTPRMLRRLEFEAEVLSRLDHPGIARVFDAGTYSGPSGEQPFLAMEFVRGRPLREWLSERPRTVEDRLELFVQICEAVQHAHEQGVVHRDIKPANIVVADDGRAKVLDFGVARLVDERERRATLDTQPGAMIGTLAYMAPEMLSGPARHADVRCDVYSLGAVLYELLAGETPVDLHGKSLADAVRAAAESEPRPLAAARPELRGDLETIVQTALSKDRERRYSSAADLAADVRRFSRREPIAARPATAWEHVRAFVRRRPALAAGLAVAAVLLALGAAAAGSQLVRARSAEAEATAARNSAELAAERAQATLEFVQRALRSADPRRGGRGAGFTALEMLDAAADELAATPPDDPLTESAIRATIAEAYVNLGAPARARDHAARAVDLRRKAAGDDETSIAEALNAHAVALDGAREHDAARASLLEAIAIYRATAPGDARLSASLVNLAADDARRGEYDAAEAHYREALEILERELGGNHGDVAWVRFHLGALQARRGELADGERTVREALEALRAHHGPRRFEVASVALWLADYLRKSERGDEAIPFYREALDGFRELLGETHAQLVEPAMFVAAAVQEHDPDEAIELYGLALGALEAGDDRALGRSWTMRSNLASLLHARGESDEAEALLRAVLDERLARLDEGHHLVALARNNLARVLAAQERFDEAEALQQRALDGWIASKGEDDALVAHARARLEEIRAARAASGR